MTGARLLLSPLAEADLIEIGDFISAGNPNRARSLILELQDFMLTIAANPLIGRSRADLRKGLRSIPVVGYSYTIYYRVLPKRQGIKVERLLHGARDISRLL